MHERTVLSACVLCCSVLLMVFHPSSQAIAPVLPVSDALADQRAAKLVAQLTLDEKIQLVHGTAICGIKFPNQPLSSGSRGGAGYVPGIPRLQIPDINYTDGPAGVTNCGARPNGQSTVFPSPLALAATWNPQVAYDTGAAMGREARAEGFAALLSGGVNLAREPRNGRTFEYMGEDPVLAGLMVAQELTGIQSQRVLATIKHFAGNEQESGRNTSSSNIGERALRELYLLPFEIGVKTSGVGSVMCAYNKVNGVHACENPYLLNDILKKEWGFRGQVQSDWGATHSTVLAANAGLDEEEFASTYFSGALAAAVTGGDVQHSRLDDMVRRKLRALIASGVMDSPPTVGRIDVAAGTAAAQRVAEESLVLLRNVPSTNRGIRKVLPLDAATVKRIAVIGGHADVGVLSGGGSSQVSPVGGPAIAPTCMPESPGGSSCPVWIPSSPLQAIRAKAPDAKIQYDDGTDPAAAAALAKTADVTIIFATQWSRESQDLPSLSLPDKQDGLIAQVSAANPNTVVILETGGPVLMPWVASVPGIIEAWYPGIRGAEALASVLFGQVNPSGKLPLTFPVREADLPSPAAPTAGDVTYSEGLYMGYRWFDGRGKTPLFPFGHGLSYTTFSESGLRTVQNAKGDVTVDFKVTNTGHRAGAEVAQVYVSLPPQAGEPPRRLIGWKKIILEAGTTADVSLPVSAQRLAIWNTRTKGWEVTGGAYTFSVGNSSRNPGATLSLTLPSHSLGSR